MTLALCGIRKRYGPVVAVESFTLDVEQGELVALLGPSGCGKTTILRLVAGFDAPDAGSIHFDGRDLTGVPPERRAIGMVFQHFALFPHLDVWHNVSYGLKFTAGRREAAARVREVLALVELVGLERRLPLELSAGQQQRVALARALAPRPRALLLDEPLTALDAALRDHLRLEIRRLQRRLGITMLYVTHDQAEAMAIADRVVVMRDGRIEQVGTPWEVYERPCSPFVASFIGGGVVLPARITARSERTVVVTAPGLAGPVPIPAERVTGPSARGPSPGAAAYLVLRPERLRVLPDGAAAADPAVLSGRLLDAEFLGATGRLTVTGPDWRATVTVDALSVPTYRQRAGDLVRIRFDPAGCVLIVA